MVKHKLTRLGGDLRGTVTYSFFPATHLPRVQEQRLEDAYPLYRTWRIYVGNLDTIV